MPERAIHGGDSTRLRDGAAGGERSTTTGAEGACARVLDHRHVALSFEIRECGPDDAERLAWMGLLPAQRASIDEAYARHAAGREVLLVAASQGFPIAVVRLELPHDGSEHDEDPIAVIAALRVMPGLQNLGIGTALLLAAERVMRERGVPTAEISIERDDLRGIARYVRRGYVAIECDACGHVVLRKSLDPFAARPLQSMPSR